jgi:hypothetical protein
LYHSQYRDRAFACVVAIALHALNFNAFALPVRHERHRINVVGKNKAPLVDVFANHVFSFPAEESFSRCRPARHTKVAVPFDTASGELST